jgi:hypothetical protein
MEIKKVNKKQLHQKKRKGFFDFKGNKFTKIARIYHHELLHLTSDLISVNRRIQESAGLCHQQINFIKEKKRHLIPSSRPICFKDALYHLENFSFRITGYRDKLVQFINQALRIGFNEKSMGVLSTIISHGTIRDARLDTELKKFDKDKDFKDALSERILMTHRRYYQIESGYNTLMMPIKETKNGNEKLKLWRQNIQAKANRADRIVLKVIDMNDRIMQKINDYFKKHPLR